MRNAKTWISLLLAPLMWVGAQADTGATADQMWQLLEAGAAHVQAVGPDQAYRDFADRGGKWQQGELRLSVLGLDGKVVIDGLGQTTPGSSTDALQDSAAVLVKSGQRVGPRRNRIRDGRSAERQGQIQDAVRDSAAALGRGILVVGATMDGARVAGYHSDK